MTESWQVILGKRQGFHSNQIVYRVIFKRIALMDLYFVLKVIKLIVTDILYGFVLMKLDW